MAKFVRRVFDKAREISAENRGLLEEEKLLGKEQKKFTNAEQTRELREEFVKKRTAIEEQMKPSTGDQFQVLVTVITTIFLIIVLFKMFSYFDASDRHMEALLANQGYYEKSE